MSYFTRGVLIVPFIAVWGLFLCRQTVRIDSITFVLIATLVIGTLFAITSLSTQTADAIRLLAELSSMHFFLMFPLLIYQLKLQRADYLWVLDHATKTIIWAGGLYIVFESISYRIGLFELETLRDILVPPSLKETFGASYGPTYQSHGRALGILLVPHASAFLLASALAYQAGRIARAPFARKDWLMLTIGCLGVFASGSIMTTMILLAVVTRELLLRQRIDAFRALVAAAVVVVAAAISPLGTRISFYLSDIGSYIPLFLPNLTDCGNLRLWSIQDPSSFCHTAEIKFIGHIFRYGPIPIIPWMLLALAPLMKWRRTLAAPDLRSSFLLCLVQILSISHYSSLESWGNNLLFSLAALSLFDLSDMRLSS